MININLLGEEKDRSATYAVHAIAFCFVVISSLAISGWIYTGKSLKLAELESEMESKKAQNESLKKRTAEVETLEAKQVLLKDKLGVIAQLKARKQGPVRILDEISKSIPDKSWITEINQSDDTLQISGVALDGQTISDFMEQIRNTPYIKETDSVSTELIVVEDLKLQKFSFPAKLVFLNAIAKKDALGEEKGSAPKDQSNTGEAKK